MKIKVASVSQAWWNQSWKNLAVSIFFRFHLSIIYDPLKTRLSESKVEAEEPWTNHKSLESSTVIGLFFCFCFWVRQWSFHLIICDRVISGISILLPIPLDGFFLSYHSAPHTREFKKFYLYFTYWSRATLKSLTLFITVKAVAKLNLGHHNKFEIEF